MGLTLSKLLHFHSTSIGMVLESLLNQITAFREFSNQWLVRKRIIGNFKQFHLFRLINTLRVRKEKQIQTFGLIFLARFSVDMSCNRTDFIRTGKRLSLLLMSWFTHRQTASKTIPSSITSKLIYN